MENYYKVQLGSAKLDMVFSVRPTLCLLAANFVVANSLDQDQNVTADLVPICLTR